MECWRLLPPAAVIHLLKRCIFSFFFQAQDIFSFFLEFLVAVLVPLALCADFAKHELFSRAFWSGLPAAQRLTKGALLARLVDVLCLYVFLQVLWVEWLIFNTVGSTSWGQFITCHELVNLLEDQVCLL